MKRTIALLLSVLLIMAAFAACTPAEPEPQKTEPPVAPTEKPVEQPTEEPTVEEPVALKTGIAVITGIDKSKDAAADADGLAQADSIVVAVTVDPDGKIQNCVIDTAQTKMNFNAEGKMTTPLDTVYKSKQQLKEEYNMKPASQIGKEWYEQANAFAEYVIGKTADEVAGIALTESLAPADAELSASVTMHVNGYIDAIVKAVGNAQDLGAKAGDKLGLGVKTTIAKSKDATADAAGLAQAYSTYAAVTYGPDGKITSCFIESSQTNVNFDVTGKLTTALDAQFKTKQELKEEYNMKPVSQIGKEWYEQANALAAYVTGKTIDEVKGIALNEGGAPADAELAASVTIHVTDYLEVIEQTAATAK
ncbi:MAG: hypothetical protein BWY11_01953 [Firmicutes bacterium ADurb.Bin182]|nr:MAG: hypothetical protein BWY11_01953 [Firmicutes bacterium ADurb.Bin182]